MCFRIQRRKTHIRQLNINAMNCQKEVLSLYKVWTEGAKWEFGEKLVIERGQADGHVECGGGCSILEG